MKARKPDFIRQDAHKRKKLGMKWRKPKGIHSKMRHRFKGHSRMVSKGYCGPKAARNLHKSGLAVRIVSTIKGIENIKKESEGAIIAANVGQKKKVEILKRAKELGVEVLNIKSIDAYLKNVEKNMEEKKKAKGKEKETKKGKKEEKLVEKLQSEEEKKIAEKKEKDKLLTKKSN